MKTKTFLLSLILSATFFLNGTAQTEDNTVLKVSYSTNNVSDFIVSVLKAKIQDPDEYSSFINKVSEYKIYHSLYQNLKTKESLYVLDSIQSVDGISTVGHAFYTFKDAQKELHGRENFMGKTFTFDGKSSSMEWKITNESKEINGYNCKKAILKGTPDVYVWFTDAIAIDAGPYVYFGLPGLVLESNSFFQTVNAETVSYTTQNVFKEQLTEVKEKMNKKKDKNFSIAEVITKKGNFKRMAEEGR